MEATKLSELDDELFAKVRLEYAEKVEFYLKMYEVAKSKVDEGDAEYLRRMIFQKD